MLRRQKRQAVKAVAAVEVDAARLRDLAKRPGLAKDNLRALVVKPKPDEATTGMADVLVQQRAVMNTYQALAPLAAGGNIAEHIEVGPDYSDAGAVMMRARTPFGEAILGQALKLINAK